MREDFVTQLRLQLREAAERDARRSPVRRLAHTLRWDAGKPAALALSVAAAVAAVAFVVLPWLRAEEPVPAGRELAVVASGPLVTRGGDLALAGGSVWATDPATGEILRLDPRTRDVRARVPAGGEPAISAGADALWAGAGGRLLRIDADTARVTGRMRLESVDVGFPVAAGEAVWVIDALELKRVDTARMAFDRTVRVARGSFMANALAVDRDVIYVQRGDGHITGYDAADGSRIASLAPRRPGGLAQAAPGALVLWTDDGVEVVDPGTGRTRWLRRLGTSSVNATVLDGRVLWVHGSDATSGRDRLWRIDLRDGRVLGTVTLPEFGVTGMAPVSGALWLVSDGGQLTVVRPG